MSLQTDTYGAAGLVPFMRPQEAVTESVVFGNSLTVVKGQVVGIKTSDGKWYAYSNANADGTETARAVAQYGFTTDANGKVTIANERSVSYDSAPVFIKGYFRTTELTGLDAAAVAELGKLTSGTVADGVLRIT